MAEGLFKTIASEITQQKPEVSEHFKPVIDSLYAKHDYSEYGGAPLLGVDGTCIICHGSSDARAIRSAIICTSELLKHQINRKICEQLQQQPVEESG